MANMAASTTFNRGLSLLILLSLCLSVAFAQTNQCFYSANERAGSAIVPCASGSAFAACCQIGDLCLSDSACWNPQYNVTYLYGCTDPTYSDYSCPFKCGPTFADAPYVGLDYCYNTTNNEWSCTHPPSNSDSIQAFDYSAQCYNDSIIAFAGPSSLLPILSLPTNVGGSTLYFSPTGTWFTPVTGYTPTTTTLPTASKPTNVELVGSTSNPDTTAIPATGASTTGPTSSSTASSTAAGASNSSNTGLKIGLGVGIVGGVLFVLAMVAFCILYRRRRHRHSAVPQSDQSDFGTSHSSGTYFGSPELKYQGHSSNPSYDSQGAGFPPVPPATGYVPYRDTTARPSELPTEDMNTYQTPPKAVIAPSPARTPAPVYTESGGSVPTESSGTRTELPAQTGAGLHELG